MRKLGPLLLDLDIRTAKLQIAVARAPVEYLCIRVAVLDLAVVREKRAERGGEDVFGRRGRGRIGDQTEKVGEHFKVIAVLRGGDL